MILVGGRILGALLVTSAAVAAECPSELQDKVKSLSKEVQKYQAPAPSQGTGGGNQQASSQGQHNANMGAAQNAASQCLAALTKFSSRADKLQSQLDEHKEDCSEESDKNEQTKKAIAKKQAECQAAANGSKAQGDKSKENQDKMGGGGGAPSPPQQQPQSSTNTSNATEKEKERQAKLKACKDAANAALPNRQKNCDVQFSYDRDHPVTDMKKRQDSCKQDAIFQQQRELQDCDSKYPATPLYPMVTPESPAQSLVATTSVGTFGEDGK